jgi:hypothetical protein
VRTSSRRMLRTAASAIAALDLIAGIVLFIHIPERSHHRSDSQCEIADEMMNYTNTNIKALNGQFDSNQFPRLDAYQQWADRMQRYAAQLGQSDGAQGWASVMKRLAYGSREIVFLFQYAQSDQASVSDAGPPPLWIKRYNDIREEFELEFAVLKNMCPA